MYSTYAPIIWQFTYNNIDEQRLIAQSHRSLTQGNEQEAPSLPLTLTQALAKAIYSSQPRALIPQRFAQSHNQTTRTTVGLTHGG